MIGFPPCTPPRPLLLLPLQCSTDPPRAEADPSATTGSGLTAATAAAAASGPALLFFSAVAVACGNLNDTGLVATALSPLPPIAFKCSAPPLRSAPRTVAVGWLGEAAAEGAYPTKFVPDKVWTNAPSIQRL